MHSLLTNMIGCNVYKTSNIPSFGLFHTCKSIYIFHVKYVFKTRNLMCLLLLPIVGEFLTQYGWYLLVVTVLVYLLIQHLSKRRSNQRDRSPPPQSQQGQHQRFPIPVYIPDTKLQGKGQINMTRWDQVQYWSGLLLRTKLGWKTTVQCFCLLQYTL